MEKSLSIIIPSKDRPLQLQLCLDSLFARCKDIDNRQKDYPDDIDIYVIVKASNDDYRIAYERLQNKYDECDKKVNFLIENNNDELQFRRYVLNCLRDNDYVFFIVDDTIFVDDFWLSTIIDGVLEKNKDILGFSLRLGLNTYHNYPSNMDQVIPEFESIIPGYISKFDWTKAEGDFGYPLEVSSSIYNVQSIFPFIYYYGFDGPNNLENLLCSCRGYFVNEKNRIACYNKSRAFSAPINKVQVIANNRAGTLERLSPEYLLKAFNQGFSINPDRFYKFLSNGCHQEVDLNIFVN